MNLLVQPEDGIQSLLKAIAGAKESVQIVIFRFDSREIERALVAAVARGVAVHALIAHTNRSGEESLRKLEMRLLGAGVNVARTADDLMRYHSKLLIVDQRELFLLAFNFTRADTERSRSFGVVTRNRALVAEAVRLVEADSGRRPYEAGSPSLVVSPVNARQALSDFIKCAKKQLLIYDPKVSDPAMLRILEERAAAGVDIRVIGKISRKLPGLKACKLRNLRLHTRSMVRDGECAFVGSQSLRALELDGRREAGMIFRDAKAVARIRETFESDWSAGENVQEGVAETAPAAKVAKKVAKAVAKELPDVTPVLNGVVQEIVGDVSVDADQVQEAVKEAVKAAVKEAVSGILEEVVTPNGEA